MYPLLSFYLRRLIRQGSLIVHTADGRQHRFGDGSGEQITIRLNTKQAERSIAHNPALKAGECYMDGELDMLEGDIMGLLRLVFSNAGLHATSEPWMKAVERARLAYRRLMQNNVPKRSRRNVKHHYDLSGKLYSLFLDGDRQYSCAYFERPDESLEEAQLAKRRHVSAKLKLERPDLDVLDIGSGWGGLGLYMAQFCGARVTGVTLSDEQFALSNKRVDDAGLRDRVSFQLRDYRSIEDRFDRIVSVGMFEHVGRDFYGAFFEQAEKLLKPDGVMLLHTIGRSDEPANTNSFINRHIFPGGYIPALSEIAPVIERSGLMITDVEVLRLHYAETLRLWREAFMAKRDEAKALYDERFCRMWEFYLAASESSFRWQRFVVFQIQLTKAVDTLPMTRGYMASAEDALRKIDTPPPVRIHEVQAAE